MFVYRVTYGRKQFLTATPLLIVAVETISARVTLQSRKVAVRNIRNLEQNSSRRNATSRRTGCFWHDLRLSTSTSASCPKTTRQCCPSRSPLRHGSAEYISSALATVLWDPCWKTCPHEDQLRDRRGHQSPVLPVHQGAGTTGAG